MHLLVSKSLLTQESFKLRSINAQCIIHNAQLRWILGFFTQIAVNFSLIYFFACFVR